MGQLSFSQTFNHPGRQRIQFNNASVATFFPFNFYDSISLNTLNVPMAPGGTSLSFTLSLGIYSLTGSTLSLANSGSFTSTIAANSEGYRSMSSFSSTQNISPGTWFFVLWGSAGTNLSLYGQNSNIAAGNAFPGAFIGGAMTASTNAFPTSYATSDLDVTGQDALLVPNIIISA